MSDVGVRKLIEAFATRQKFVRFLVGGGALGGAPVCRWWARGTREGETQAR